MYKKPLPKLTDVSEKYWRSARNHEFLLQKCENCGETIYYPRMVCPKCLSSHLGWIRASGRGTVYSYSIVNRPPSKEFSEDVPYILALVELAEGPKMITNIVNCEPGKVEIGMKVEVVFDDVTEDISLPKFKPASPSSN